MIGLLSISYGQLLIFLVHKNCSIVAGVFGIASALPEGVIDLAEGAALRDRVTATGFSYGLVSIRATVLTYNQFRAGGFDPSVVFDPIDVPEKAADGKAVFIAFIITEYLT